MLEETIITELIKWGGGTAIIIALVFLFRTLVPLINNRKDNGKINNFDKRLKAIENDKSHDFDYLREKVDKLEDKLNNLENRIIRVEIRMDDKNITYDLVEKTKIH